MSCLIAFYCVSNMIGLVRYLTNKRLTAVEQAFDS